MLGYFVALAVVVWIAQTVLGLRQFKKFNKHLLEMRQEGRVAIGRARGRFAAGVLVLFVIDDDCRILRGEIMEGRTVFAGFKPFEHFNGLTLFELSDDLCKSMKLSFQQAIAVMSAQKEYESNKLMRNEENLATA
ncbi:MAG: transcriptional regulator GutM [Selenomonadaceae bacterium]|nr:transcriptional regulator GutM [Selenomonadaceae bacterium]